MASIFVEAGSPVLKPWVVHGRGETMNDRCPICERKIYNGQTVRRIMLNGKMVEVHSGCDTSEEVK
jgi:hypothetical protein